MKIMNFELTDLKYCSIGESPTVITIKDSPVKVSADIPRAEFFYLYRKTDEKIDIYRLNVNLSESAKLQKSGEPYATRIDFEILDYIIIKEDYRFTLFQKRDESQFVLFNKIPEYDVDRDFVIDDKRKKTISVSFETGKITVEIYNDDSERQIEIAQILDVYFISSDLPFNVVYDYIVKNFYL